MRRQVANRFQVPRRGGPTGDGDRVGVASRRGRQNRKVTGQSLVELQLDGVEHGRREGWCEVLQEVANVLRYQVDGVVFESWDVRLTASDSHPPPDIEAVGLQRLCVDFGDDL